MYIDESGDTIELSRGGKQFLVLTGCIIHESDRVAIEQPLRGIKQEFYQNPDVEIKSNFLRYANPDLDTTSPLKLHDRDRYNSLEDKVTDLLGTIAGNAAYCRHRQRGFLAKIPRQKSL